MMIPVKMTHGGTMNLEVQGTAFKDRDGSGRK